MASEDVCDGDTTLSLLLCSDCETEEHVNWFCQECQHNFCDKCKDHHLRRKKSRTHSIVPFREAKYRPVYINKALCGVHPGESLDYWCEDCDVTICVKCIPDRHKKHSWCTVDDFRCRVQVNIHSKIDEFRETLLKYRGVMNDDSKFSEYMNCCIDHLKEDVNNQASTLCLEVNKKRDEVLNEVTIFENKAKIQQNQSKLKMTEDMAALNELITNTEQSLKGCESSSSLSVLLKTIEDTSGCFQSPESVRRQPPTLSKPEYVDQSKLVSLFGQLEYPSSQKLEERVKYEVKTKYLKTKTIRKILALCVLDNGNIWVSFDGNRFLMLIDGYLNAIKKSCDTEKGVVSMALYKNTDLVFTRFMDTSVQRIGCHGDKMVTIADLDPYYTKGISVNNENRLLVCAVTTTCSKIVKMTGRGQILLEIPIDRNDIETLTRPYRITSFDTGEMFVVDTAKDDHRVTCLAKQGERLFSWSWRGEGVGTVEPLGITNDKTACYITDEKNNRIYVLPKNGNTAAVLLDESSRQTGPRCITIDRKGCLWVGCNNGVILKIER
ncbi:uncharacterized protein LOC110449474 [Mizuhopecten yessoensis]|uniref:uncharacterized protein LOC110449474 n=1 Tax=Mizuhopecten yessoensis TaxID=6573 RepID=UPI000B45DD33|nr:uncharacterized protein LOC110449474 [Mizuhopecten yessoensis]